MTHPANGSDERLREDLRFALHDWLDFHDTPRRIIARRVRSKPLPQLEAEMLRSATGLLEDGRISIIVKKRDGITTYLAERVL